MSARDREPEVRAALRRFLLIDVLHGSLADLEDDEPLITTGLIDSFSVVQLAVHAEDAFDVRLDDDELEPEHFDTLDQMVEAVLARMP